MDADLVVEYLKRSLLLLGGGVAVAAVATWLTGAISRRGGVSNGLTLVAQLLTPVALFYAASLYLDAAGQVVQARVKSTEERVSYQSSGRTIPGAWSRSFWASVEFDGPDGPGQAPLWIDEATYDALQPGAPIVVRYLPWLPFLARPADQTTRAFVPWRWLTIGLAILGVVLVLRPLMRRVHAGLKALAGLVIVGTAVVIWVFPTPWETPLEPPILTAEAEVLRLREETRAFISGRTTGSVRAPQPWNVVEVRFVPAGRDKAVIAVDSVDVGSVAGLQIGARLPVTYNARNPRDARLAGTRTWRQKEWGELVEFAVMGVIAIGALILLQKVAGAWWRRTMRRS